MVTGPPPHIFAGMHDDNELSERAKQSFKFMSEDNLKSIVREYSEISHRSDLPACVQEYTASVVSFINSMKQPPEIYGMHRQQCQMCGKLIK